MNQPARGKFSPLLATRIVPRRLLALSDGAVDPTSVLFASGIHPAGRILDRRLDLAGALDRVVLVAGGGPPFSIPDNAGNFDPL